MWTSSSLLVLISSLFPSTISSFCHQIPISLDLNSNCQDSIDGNSRFCTIKLREAFSLSTDQQNDCIEFLNKGDSIAKFNVNLVEYLRVCDEELEFFTRDVEIRYSSSKRCRHAGSCQVPYSLTIC